MTISRVITSDGYEEEVDLDQLSDEELQNIDEVIEQDIDRQIAIKHGEKDY